MSTLQVRIRNATVMLPSGPARRTVGIRDGRILLDPPDTLHAEREIDATGLTLMPGVIDAHLHFRDPGFPHKEDLFTGPLAAVTGGVTSFFEMPNTAPSTTSQARLAEKLAIAARKSLANYGFYLGATSDAAGAPGNLPDLAALRRGPASRSLSAPAPAICSSTIRLRSSASSRRPARPSAPTAKMKRPSSPTVRRS